MVHEGVCPITLTDVRYLESPVVGSDGHTYERSAVVAWLKQHGTSPVTRAKMRIGDLIPNRVLMTGSGNGEADISARYVLAVDVSACREGLTARQKGACACVDRLRERDSLCIFACSDDCVQVLPDTRMNRYGRQLATRCIDELQEEGSSDVGQAMHACLSFCERKRTLPSFVLLVTRGQRPEREDEEALSRYISRVELPETYFMQVLAVGAVDSEFMQKVCLDLETASAGSRALFSYTPDPDRLQDMAKLFVSNSRRLPPTGLQKTNYSKLLRKLLRICSKTGHSSWYGLPGGVRELPPSSSQLDSALVLYKAYLRDEGNAPSDDLEAAFAPSAYTLWGRHHIRSIVSCHEQRICADSLVSSTQIFAPTNATP